MNRILARLLLALGAAPVAIFACGDGQDPSGTQSTGSTCQRALPAGGQEFCHTASDCKDGPGSICTAVDPLPSCGAGAEAPLPPSCTSDEECSAGGSAGAASVCQDQGDRSSCLPPCFEDGDCTSIQRCEVATGHCKPRPCDESTPCAAGTFCAASGVCKGKLCDPDAQNACPLGRFCDPALFACVASPCTTTQGCPDLFVCESGACQQQPCACDVECGTGGYCIRGKCQESAGVCAGNIVCGRPLLVAGAAVTAALASDSAWG